MRNPPRYSLAAQIVLLPIRFYRYAISPLFPGCCRFQPTCSEYALLALRERGLRRGGWLAVRRLLRCHPVRALGGGAGYDPLPQDETR